MVKYLARYVGRTAISDERIVTMNDEAATSASASVVTFRYTDTKTQQRRERTLSADEFMRRYLHHVLPPGQHRAQVETLLAVPIVVRTKVEEPAWHLRCPHCERFSLVRVGSLPRQARAPPICR